MPTYHVVVETRRRYTYRVDAATATAAADVWREGNCVSQEGDRATVFSVGEAE